MLSPRKSMRVSREHHLLASPANLSAALACNDAPSGSSRSPSKRKRGAGIAATGVPTTAGATRGRRRKLISAEDSMSLLMDTSIAMLQSHAAEEGPARPRRKISPRKALSPRVLSKAAAAPHLAATDTNADGARKASELDLDKLNEAELENLAWQEEEAQKSRKPNKDGSKGRGTEKAAATRKRSSQSALPPPEVVSASTPTSRRKAGMLTSSTTRYTTIIAVSPPAATSASSAVADKQTNREPSNDADECTTARPLEAAPPRSPSKSRIPSPTKAAAVKKRSDKSDGSGSADPSLIAATLSTNAESREARRRRLGLAPLLSAAQTTGCDEEQISQADTAAVASSAMGSAEVKEVPVSALEERKQSTEDNDQFQPQTSSCEDSRKKDALAEVNAPSKPDIAQSKTEMTAKLQVRRSARISVSDDKHIESTPAEAKSGETHQIRQEKPPASGTWELHKQPPSSSGLTVPRGFGISAAKKDARRTSPRKAVSSMTANAGANKKTLADCSKKAKKIEREFKKASIAASTTSLGKGRPTSGSQSVRTGSAAALSTAPAGFRITSSGQLVPQHTSSVFSFDAEGASASGYSSMTARQKEMLDGKRAKEAASKTTQAEMKARSGYTANGVPTWLKQRKEQLQAEEEERIKKQMELARQKELADGKGKRKAASASEKAEATGAAGRKGNSSKTVPKPFVSSLEARAAERADWEARRKANEEAIEAARQEAREEKLRQEEEEYKEARKRAVPKANPVPEWLYGGTVERLPAGSGELNERKVAP